MDQQNRQGFFDTFIPSLQNTNPPSSCNSSISAFESSNGPVVPANDIFSTNSNNNGTPQQIEMNGTEDEDSDISQQSTKKKRFNFSLKKVFGKDNNNSNNNSNNNNNNNNNYNAKSKYRSTLLSKFRKLTIADKKKTKSNDTDSISDVQIDEGSISYNHESPCPYGCKNCGASFDTVEVLATHIKKGHCRAQVKSVFSSDWDEVSTERSRSQSVSERAKSLSNKYAKDRADFACTVCNKKFSYKWNLQRHMQVHNTEKKFSCEVCGKKFRHKGNVKIHMAKHTKEERYQCKKCGRKFSWHSSLKRHRCIPKN